MRIEDIIIIIILLVIVAAVGFYIYKEKKKGSKCIGCPYGKECSGKCASQNKK